MSYLTSSNSQLFKNITYVGSFGHFHVQISFTWEKILGKKSLEDQIRGRVKIVAGQIVFLAKEEKVAPVGVRGSPTLYSVLSVERSWQHTLVSLVEMVFQEAKNTVRSTMQKMRTIPSSGCTLYTIIRGEMMSLTT